MDLIVGSKPSLALLRLLFEADILFAWISALLLWKRVAGLREFAARLSRQAVTSALIPALMTQ